MGCSAGPNIVEDGLVLALDAGNSQKSYKTDNNLLDPSTWYVGATSVTGFGFNGAAGENALISDTDPFGNTAVIWKAYNPDGNSDGGWSTSYMNVDHTKLYRFSVWVNRKVTGTDGRFYFGTQGLNSSNSNVGVLFRTSGNNETNPYFYYSSEPPTSSEMPEDEWLLVVGHIWPSGSGTGSNKDDTGIYNTDGTKRNITTPVTPRDFVWNTTVAKTVHRTFLFYSEGDASVIQHWAYPRIDLVDGTEPSIDDLINNRVNSLYVYDICGQNNHGTLLNGVSHASANNGYFEFDGSDDYIPLVDNFGDPQQFTIEFWAYPTELNIDANNNYRRLFIPVGATSNGSNFIMIEQNGNISFRVPGGTTDNMTGSGFSGVNQWGHIVCTYDQSNKKIYFNGDLKTTTAEASLTVDFGSPQIVDPNWQTFKGRIANAKVYNKALSASEVAQNFNALRGRFGI